MATHESIDGFRYSEFLEMAEASRSDQRHGGATAIFRALLKSICTERARFDDQFHRYQYRLKACSGHGGQHQGQDPVPANPAHQVVAQSLQRRGHVGKRSAVAQRAGLALHQRNVVLPVVADVAARFRRYRLELKNNRAVMPRYTVFDRQLDQIVRGDCKIYGTKFCYRTLSENAVPLPLADNRAAKVDDVLRHWVRHHLTLLETCEGFTLLEVRAKDGRFQQHGTCTDLLESDTQRRKQSFIQDVAGGS